MKKTFDVNTNAETISAKEAAIGGLWLGAALYAVTKGIKHCFNAGKAEGINDMVKMIHNMNDDD
jgi:hypothetical protein